MVRRAGKQHTFSPCWSIFTAWWLSDALALMQVTRSHLAIPFAFFSLWTQFRERAWDQSLGLPNVYKAQETQSPHTCSFVPSWVTSLS